MHRPPDASTRGSTPAPAAVQPLLPGAALTRRTRQSHRTPPHTGTRRPASRTGHQTLAPGTARTLSPLHSHHAPEPHAPAELADYTPILSADRRTRPRYHHTTTPAPYTGMEKRTAPHRSSPFCSILSDYSRMLFFHRGFGAVRSLLSGSFCLSRSFALSGSFLLVLMGSPAEGYQTAAFPDAHNTHTAGIPALGGDLCHRGYG